MDAPKGRYRVVEKDGRLVVIDNGTGAPVPSSIKPLPRSSAPGPSAAPIIGAKGAIDTIADLLLRLVVKGWDDEGRAIIHWTWKENGRPRRWDALLDSDQQRRLGRALATLLTLPVLLLAFILGEGALIWLAILLVVPATIWSAVSIKRLQSETSGQMPPNA